MWVKGKPLFRRVIFSVSFFCVLFSASTIRGTPEFIVFSSSDELTKETTKILQRSCQRLSRIFGDTLTGPVSVYVADTEQEFQARTGSSFPDWGIGCAIPSRHLIVVKSPAHFKYGKSLKQVLEHELAHIFLGAKVKGQNIPRWLDEGFAMMHSHEWTLGQDVVVARAVLTNSIFPLSEIERLNSFRESRAHLAYTLSFLAVSYLFREYGEESFVELVNLLSRGESWDGSLLKTTGSDYRDFQDEFLVYIKSRYQWISLLGDTFFLWVGLAFLIIFVYLLKKRHTKKILRRWDQEEKGSTDEEKTH